MWEKRVDVLMMLLSSPRHGLLKVDERWIAPISGSLIGLGRLATERADRDRAAFGRRTMPERG
jgi:hypothetical protein